jgi:hypothetical protein
MGAGKKRVRSRVPFGLQNYLSSGARLGHAARLRGKRAGGPGSPGNTEPTEAWTPGGAAGAPCDPDTWGPEDRGCLSPKRPPPPERPETLDPPPAPTTPPGTRTHPPEAPATNQGPPPPYQEATEKAWEENQQDPSIPRSGSGSGSGSEEDEGGAAAAGPAPADLHLPWRPRPARVHPGEPNARSMKGPRVTGALPATPSEAACAAKSSTEASSSTSEPSSDGDKAQNLEPVGGRGEVGDEGRGALLPASRSAPQEAPAWSPDETPETLILAVCCLFWSYLSSSSQIALSLWKLTHLRRR